MEKLTTFEAEMLVRWFEQRITPEQRHRLMRELPQAYNRMVGWQVVRVEMAERAPCACGTEERAGS